MLHSGSRIQVCCSCPCAQMLWSLQVAEHLSAQVQQVATLDAGAGVWQLQWDPLGLQLAGSTDDGQAIALACKPACTSGLVCLLCKLCGLLRASLCAGPRLEGQHAGGVCVHQPLEGGRWRGSAGRVRLQAAS